MSIYRELKEIEGDCLLQFGKHKGSLCSELVEIDPEYLLWLTDKYPKSSAGKWVMENIEKFNLDPDF
jgi:uncharacterized protein (DUF3820 family)